MADIKTHTSLFVKNFRDSMTEAQILELLEPMGEITSP